MEENPCLIHPNVNPMALIPPYAQVFGHEHVPHCKWAGQCPYLAVEAQKSEAIGGDEVDDHPSFKAEHHFPCRKNNAPNLVGIPTIEGMEFLKPKEIIRCEGMQRLTKVFTECGAILSSYNIGEFCRLLRPFGFFSPHKSHLVNLHYLRRYHAEGAITLRDGSRVPLARRKREAFLEKVKHL